MARLSPAQIEQYRLSGYLFIENYFSSQEMDLLLEIARADEQLAADANDSPLPRWSLICCYSAANNPTFNADGAGQYEPLEIGDDDSILTYRRDGVGD